MRLSLNFGSFERAGGWIGGAGSAGIEFTTAGMSFVVEGGSLSAAFDGGEFALRVDGVEKSWPSRAVLKAGSVVDITPGRRGNYGYARFDRELDLPAVLGSRATSSIAGLGGFDGRALVAGDVVSFGEAPSRGPSQHPRSVAPQEGAIRVVWGIHADAFDGETREWFVVYEALYGEGGMFVRPAAMFVETVEVGGKRVPRFARVGD